MHKLLPIFSAAFLAAPAAARYAQSSDGGASFGGTDAAGGTPVVSGGLIPDDDAPGPVANVDAAEYKFDGPVGTYVFWISASDGKGSEREPFVVDVQ